MTRDQSSSLWNTSVDARNYESPNDKYLAAILEQYKLYVEMAERVSQRRGAANSFFLTLNSAILTTIGIFWTDHIEAPSWLLGMPLVGAVVQCGGWYMLVRSYRQLSSAKWSAVAAFEERLPAFAYSEAEWQSLARGADWRVYLPLTRLEQWIPATFASIYIIALVLALTL